MLLTTTWLHTTPLICQVGRPSALTVGGATELVQNTATEEAATKVQVTGTIKNPQLDAWQAAMRLLQNAFFQIIVPRFERPIRPGNRAELTIE